jgi:G3E family GTPase
VNFESTRCEEWESQIRCADLVVLAKVDLADAPALDRARAAVRALRPGARILEGGPDLPFPALLDLEAGSSAPAAPHGHHSDFRAATVSDRAVYRLEPLEDLLEALPERIFRAKGIVRLEGGRWASFQVVGGRLQLTRGDDAPAHGESRVVAFGRGLAAADLLALLRPCRAA